MGAFFEPYKKYYDNLNTSKTNVARSLADSCSSYLNNLKNDFLQVKGSIWQETGRENVISVFNKTISNINELNEFITNNLVSSCIFSDDLHSKVVEIKTNDDNLESLKSSLSSEQSKLNQMSRETNNYIKNGGIIKNREVVVGTIETKSGKRYEKVVDTVPSDNSRMIDEQIAKVKSLENQISRIGDILHKLCIEANNLIDKILELDGQDKLTRLNVINGLIGSNEVLNIIGKTPNLGNDVASLEFVYGKSGSRYGRGSYLYVTLTNGLKYPVYKQSDYGSYSGVKSSVKGANVNTCSVLAVGSALSYLLQVDATDIDLGQIADYGGQFSSLKAILEDGKPLNINGVPHKITAEYYSGRLEYGSGSDKQKVISDFYEALRDDDAVVLLNVAEAKQGYNGNINGVEYDLTPQDIKNITGIDSNGGHVISFMSLDSENKILCSDSMFQVDYEGLDIKNKNNNLIMGYNKGVSPEEFMAFYGGDRKVKGGSDGGGIYRVYYVLKGLKATPII